MAAPSMHPNSWASRSPDTGTLSDFTLASVIKHGGHGTIWISVVLLVVSVVLLAVWRLVVTKALLDVTTALLDVTTALVDVTTALVVLPIDATKSVSTLHFRWHLSRVLYGVTNSAALFLTCQLLHQISQRCPT